MEINITGKNIREFIKRELKIDVAGAEFCIMPFNTEKNDFDINEIVFSEDINVQNEIKKLDKGNPLLPTLLRIYLENLPNKDMPNGHLECMVILDAKECVATVREWEDDGEESVLYPDKEKTVNLTNELRHYLFDNVADYDEYLKEVVTVENETLKGYNTKKGKGEIPPFLTEEKRIELIKENNRILQGIANFQKGK